MADLIWMPEPDCQTIKISNRICGERCSPQKTNNSEIRAHAMHVACVCVHKFCQNRNLIVSDDGICHVETLCPLTGVEFSAETETFAKKDKNRIEQMKSTNIFQLKAFECGHANIRLLFQCCSAREGVAREFGEGLLHISKRISRRELVRFSVKII